MAVKGFAEGKRIAHVDIDPSEIDKTVKTDLSVAADLRTFLRHALEIGRSAQHAAWLARVGTWREQMPKPYGDGDYIKPQAVIEAISELTAATPPWSRVWASTRCGRPSTTVSRGRASGSAPGAWGPWASGSRRHRGLVCEPGQAGGAHRRRRQLPDEHPGVGTLVSNRIPVKMFVLNNGYLGMVRQWEDMMDGGNHYETCLSRTAECDPACVDMDQACRTQLPNLTALQFVYPRLKTMRVRKPEALTSGRGEASSTRPGAGGRLDRQGGGRAAHGPAG